MSDEERKAIEIQDSISILENTDLDINSIYSIDLRTYNIAVQTVLNLTKKQSKEIKELKEDRKSYAEEYIHNNPWLYKQLNEVYILRTESKQKEKEAYNFGYRNGCNDTSKFNDKTFIRIDKLKEILGIKETDSEKILALLQTLVDENARLEDIEDKKVQIEYNNVFNKGVKSVEDKIKAKIKELEKGNKNTFIRGEKILVLQSLLKRSNNV